MLMQMFKKNKVWISASYLLLVAEFAVFAMMPFFMGKAVDALLANDSWWFNFWLVASLVALLVGFTRRRFDNRVFLRIWANMASDVICRMVKEDRDRTQIVSRSYMVKEFAHFLEFTIPAVVAAVVDIGVSIVMLWIFAPGLGPWLLLILTVACVGCYLFSIFINRAEIRCQLGREKIADAIMTSENAEIVKGYEDQRRNYVRLSDLDACNWGLTDVMGILAAVIVVLSVSTIPEITAGVIMANMLYVNKMFEKSCFIAFFFKHYMQVKTFTKFLNGDMEKK